MGASVEIRSIGALEPSLAGVGCNNFGRLLAFEDSQAVINAALELGITHFDTSDSYDDGESERQLGRALGGHRSSVIITTKFGALPTADGIPTGSAAAVRRSCEASLDRLGTDYIDLYLMHYPDSETPIQETLAALTALQREGKIREIGCSNFTPTELDDAAHAAAELDVRGFVALQSSYSLLDRTIEPSVLPKCIDRGLALLPYFPLASGMLTGKYRRGAEPPVGSRLASTVYGSRYQALRTDASFDVVESLTVFAEERDHSLLELALGWLAARPAVASIVAGATKPEQVRANAAGVSAWLLTDDENATVDEITSATTAVSYTVHARSPSYTKSPPGVSNRP
jgi:aryl-alcohol dehydrogenase-like predicted oxidoreductase